MNEKMRDMSVYYLWEWQRPDSTKHATQITSRAESKKILLKNIHLTE